MKRILLSLTLIAAYNLHATTSQEEVIKEFTKIITNADYEQFKIEFTKYCTQAHFTNQNVNKMRKALLKISTKSKTDLESELKAMGTQKANFKKIIVGSLQLTGAAWSGLDFAGIVYSLASNNYVYQMAQLEAKTGKFVPWVLMPWTKFAKYLRSTAGTFREKEDSEKFTIAGLIFHPFICIGLIISGIENLTEGLNYKGVLTHKVKEATAIIDFLTNYPH